MTATGKRMRKAEGLNRYQLKRAHHARKRPGKCFRGVPSKKTKS